MNESMMQKQATDLHEKHIMVQRVCADFSGPQQGDRNSTTGNKLIRLQNQFANDWRITLAAQTENRRHREITAMSKSKIDEKISEWNAANAAPVGLDHAHYMLLSLGHPYLDSLSNQTHSKR